MARSVFFDKVCHVADEHSLCHVTRAELQELENPWTADDVEAAEGLRRITQVHRVRAEEFRSERGFLRALAELARADRLLQAELQREPGRIAQGVLLLAVLELNCHHTDFARRKEALDAGWLALDISQQCCHPRLEADTRMALGRAYVDTQAETAHEMASAAIEIYHRLDEPLMEGQAWHLAAMGKYHALQYVSAYKAAKCAKELLRESKAHEALELFTLARFCICPEISRYTEALLHASHAVDLFQQMPHNHGFHASAVCMKVEAMAHLGQVHEARHLAFAAIEEFTSEDNLPAVVELQQCLMFCCCQNESEALSTANESLTTVRGFGDAEWEVKALYMVSSQYAQLGDGEEARKLLEEALQLAQRTSDDVTEWAVLYRLVGMCGGTEALQLLQQLQELCKRTGDRMREGWTLLLLSQKLSETSLVTAEDEDAAVAAAEQARTVFAELGVLAGEASCWDRIAQSYVLDFDDRPRNLTRALRIADQVRELHRRNGDPEREAKLLQRVYTKIYEAMDNDYGALACMEEAVAIVKAMRNDPHLTARMLGLLVQRRGDFACRIENHHSRVYIKQHRLVLKEAKEALHYAEKTEDWLLIGDLALLLGELRVGEGKEPETRVMKLLAKADLHDDDFQARKALLEAEVLLLRGKLESALVHAKRALDLAAANPPMQEMVRNVLSTIEERLRGAQGHVNHQETLVKVAVANIGLSVDRDTELVEAGVDSLESVALRNQIMKFTGLSLPASLIYDYPTQRQIEEYLLFLNAQEPSRAAEGSPAAAFSY